MSEEVSDITNEVRILNNLRRIDKHLFTIKIGVFIIAICALSFALIIFSGKNPF